MTAAVIPVMLLVGAIAGVISFGLVQSLARIFPRGRERIELPRLEPVGRPQRMRTATLQ
jgi:hypothetical protein